MMIEHLYYQQVKNTV